MRHPGRDLGSKRRKELTSRLQLLRRDEKRLHRALTSEDNNDAMDQKLLDLLKKVEKSIDQIQSAFALGEVKYESEAAKRDPRQSGLDFT